MSDVHMPDSASILNEMIFQPHPSDAGLLAVDLAMARLDADFCLDAIIARGATPWAILCADGRYTVGESIMIGRRVDIQTRAERRDLEDWWLSDDARRRLFLDALRRRGLAVHH